MPLLYNTYEIASRFISTNVVLVSTIILVVIIHLIYSKHQYLPINIRIKNDLVVFSPVQHPLLRIISPDLLSNYNGKLTNSSKPTNNNPLWIAVYNDIYKLVVVYDVSSKREYYGHNQVYNCLVGRDASINLATMNLDTSISQSLVDIPLPQRKVLLEWANRYDTMYPVIGHLHPHSTGLKLQNSGNYITRTMFDTLHRRELEINDFPIFDQKLLHVYREQNKRNKLGKVDVGTDMNAMMSNDGEVSEDSTIESIQIPERSLYSISPYYEKHIRYAKQSTTDEMGNINHHQSKHRNAFTSTSITPTRIGTPASMSMDSHDNIFPLSQSSTSAISQPKIDHSSTGTPSIPGFHLLRK